MVKKHIATVHVEANLSLLEEKMFNVLLENAYPKLLKQRSHTMRYTVLCELIGYSSGDRQSIKNALRKIAKTQIEWVGQNEEGKEITWKVYNYLSSAEVSWGGDSFTYGFDEKLAEKLYNPEVFAKISLISQRKFVSKYTLYLYENCARYRKNAKFQGLTPKWEVDLFRKFMGVANIKLYESFAELNRRIIKPAMKEINAVSDIYLTLETIRAGRKVTGLQFLVEDNPNQSQMQIPGVEDQMDLKDASENPVVQKCVQLGVGDGIAIQWLKAYGEAYILEKIGLAEMQLNSGKIRTSVGGWLVRAVTDDYKDEAHQIGSAKKEKREQKRLHQEAEWEENERKAAAQREARVQTRSTVASYFSNLSIEERKQEQDGFFLATGVSHEEKEAFHDWLAEKKNL